MSSSGNFEGDPEILLVETYNQAILISFSVFGGPYRAGLPTLYNFGMTLL